MVDEREAQDELNNLPQPVVVEQRRFIPSLIWLVPLLAAIIGASVLIGNYRSIGAKITISFQNAQGIEAGKTQVRYKQVVIGRVHAVSLSQDNAHVLVHVELARDAHGFDVADARYWVVRPRVGVGGVSGLGTLFSGSYIGADAGTSANQQTEFNGLEQPPAILHGDRGRSFVLESNDLGSLDIGSPVYFRRLRVGRVTGYLLDADGKGVTLQLFVDAPYDRFVNASTHFWNASGVDLALNASGLKVNTQSLATVIAGGVAFQSTDENITQPAAENSVFELYSEVGEAMRAPDGPAVAIRMHFDESLRGLSIGSPVDFRGVILGKVTAIELDYDPKSQTFPADVTATIYPKRLGHINARFLLPGEKAADIGTVLQALVVHGFRAQAKVGNLLTQQLYIAISMVPHAKPAKFDPAARPLEIPTAPGSLEEIQQQVADILTKLNKLPLVEIGENLSGTLQGSNALMKQLRTQLAPQARDMLDSAQKAMDAANATLSGNAPLGRETANTLEQLQRAARSLRSLADYLQRHPQALLRGKPADPTIPEKAQP